MENLLTPEQLRAPGELPSACVLVEEWGGSVRVRRWDAVERDRFDKESLVIMEAGGEPQQNIRARLVAHCLVDTEGKQIFLRQRKDGGWEIDPDAIRDLGHKDAVGLARVYRICRDLNTFPDDEDDEGDAGN